MDNPIRKLIQLVLDRASAKKVEDDTKKTTQNVDKQFNVLEKTAKRLGAALLAAFGITAMTRWFKESMRMAREEEAAFASLGSTIDSALGEGKWKEMEADIRALAAAMQDATTIADDEYAAGLQQMIGITGDVEASINNMGLAANVASRYYRGELGPAVELVARVSTGFTRQLKTLGIQTKSAQEGLDILAQRSLGATADAVQTTNGKLTWLNNKWSDFREAVGGAIQSGTEGGDVLGLLTTVIIKLTDWVGRNQKGIGQWAGFMLKTVVYAVNAVYQTIAGLGDLMFSVFGVTVGTVTRGLALLAKGFALVAEGGAKAAKFLGIEGAAEKIDEFAGRVKQLAQEVDNYGAALMEVGQESYRSAKGRSYRIDWAPPAAPPGVDIKRPMLAKGKGTEEETEKETTEKEKLTRSQERLNDAMERGEDIAKSMRSPMGEYIDTVRELEELLVLGAISQDTYNQALNKADEALRNAMDPASEILKGHEDQMETNSVLASVLAEQFDALQEEESLLLTTIRALADEGVDPLDERFAKLVARLKEVQRGMQNVAKESEIAGEIASSVGDVVGAAFGGDMGRIASMKARQNAILAAEQLAYAAAASAGLVTAMQAGKHLAAAAKYAAVAAAWGGFAAMTGGMGGGGGGAPASGGRDAGGSRGERAQQIGAEINITLVGEGFDAVNPKVQRVVAGAIDEWQKNGGPNARVRLQRRMTQ